MREADGRTLDELGCLAALGWSGKDMALWLGVRERELEEAPECAAFREAISRGRLEKRAEIEIAVARAAGKGDLAAVKSFSEIVRDKSFSFSKLDLFGGAEREGALEKIQEYIAGGSKGELPRKEQVYIDLLTLVYSLDGQYGKRRTIRFLTSQPFGLPYDRAATVYSEAVELFYCNRNVSREALRNKLADQFDSLYIAARDAARTTRDFEAAAGILASKARALQLDKEEPRTLPPEAYTRPFRILSLSPEAIGLPPANRDELARQIDAVAAPEAVKRRLRQDSGIEDLDIAKWIEDEKEEG